MFNEISLNIVGLVFCYKENIVGIFEKLACVQLAVLVVVIENFNEVELVKEVSLLNITLVCYSITIKP